MTPDAQDLLGPLLRDVSRSFYLTLRVLPGRIRPQIGLAYLLARTTDTIADTEWVPIDRRLSGLSELRDRILGVRRQAVEYTDLAGRQGSAAERVLLERCEQAIGLLDKLSARDRELVRGVLKTIVSGQELDLRRFGQASPANVQALQSSEELDDYTYRVAGCVGEFWTRMCREHLFPKREMDDRFLLSNGVRFGKGLQLVNILRDCAEDAHKGRCYLPEKELVEVKLVPESLLDSANERAFRPVYNRWLDIARGHLSAGWAYTNALPRTQARVRLACAWPILIGFETLRLLRDGPVLNPAKKVKITRETVRRILFRSVMLYPFRSAWKQLAA